MAEVHRLSNAWIDENARMKSFLQSLFLPVALVLFALVALKISSDWRQTATEMQQTATHIAATADKISSDALGAAEQAKKDAPVIARESGKEFVRGAGGEIVKGAAVVAVAPVALQAVPVVAVLPKKNQEKLKRWLKKTF
jgi:hypothetical protein